METMMAKARSRSVRSADNVEFIRVSYSDQRTVDTHLKIVNIFSNFYRLNFYRPSGDGLIKSNAIVKSLFIEVVDTQNGKEIIDHTK